MKLGAISLAFALVLTAAAHAQQTRFYGPDGKSTSAKAREIAPSFMAVAPRA